MRTPSLRFFALALLFPLFATAASAAGTVRLYGYYTRSNYIKVERDQAAPSARGYIVLTEFNQPGETRIDIVHWVQTRSIPSQHFVDGTMNGEKISVVWTDGVRGGRATAAGIRFGEDQFRPIQVLPNP